MLRAAVSSADGDIAASADSAAFIKRRVSKVPCSAALANSVEVATEKKMTLVPLNL